MDNMENGKVVGWLMFAGFILMSLAKFANDMFDNEMLLTMYIPGCLVLGALGIILVTDWQGMRTQFVAVMKERLRQSEQPHRFVSLFSEPVILRVCGMLLVVGAIALLVDASRPILRLITSQ